MPKKILITSALPYANGSIHLGHLVEYLQTDIYVRFLRSMGRDVVYVCADDTHGTPIEVNARKQGIPPEELVGRYFVEHQKDFADFQIQFDAYGSTNSEENRKYAELIFERLRKGGYIEKRSQELTYCEKDQRFLPDRFVKGTCPYCKAKDQYGDVCEVSGHTYSPTDLIDPHCVLCGTKPVRRASEHYFFKLAKLTDFLKEWTRQEGTLDPAISNFVGGWFEKGLQDWDISRDGPYFGFKIPGEADKYFYVWLDAPICYISTTERYLKAKKGKGDALEYWAEDADTEIIHVIGKDIVYFHALFWPAVLKAAGFKRPSRVVVHGMLTVNGEKMSKSRGTFIQARQYLDKLDPSYLRYFYAAHLSPHPEDLDLSMKEFRLRVNAELVNNIGNLCNRSLSLLAGRLDGKLAPDRPLELLRGGLDAAAEVRASYEALDFRSAVRGIAAIAERANKYLQDKAPWAQLGKDPEAARRDLSAAAEVAYLLGALLWPVVPKLSEELFAQLNVPVLTFKELQGKSGSLLPKEHQIGAPKPLIARLEESQVAGLTVPEQAKEEKVSSTTEAGPRPKAESEQAEAQGPISADEFFRVDLRVGKILSAERVPKADKLLKLSVDLGEGTPRTIAAGIGQHYAPEQVVGKRVVVVANLAPRLIRGIESRGMLLAASAGPSLVLAEVPGELPPGAQVR